MILTVSKVVYATWRVLKIMGFEIVFDIFSWHRSNYCYPSPKNVKQQVLRRNGFVRGTWVETGTYLGDTTRFLSKNFAQVISIEPDLVMFSRASKIFSQNKRVQLVFGTSEAKLPEVLLSISGDVNFWLDGHYSGPGTFCSEVETPVMAELTAIENRLSNFGNVCVLIDDIRLFQNKTKNPDYPDLELVIQWAKSNLFDWHIEHDIFVAKRWA